MACRRAGADTVAQPDTGLLVLTEDGDRISPKCGVGFPQMCVSSCIALFLACIVTRPSSILFAHVSCVYFMYFAGFEDVCRPRPTIHVFDTRFKSSLSILHDTCKYLHPNLDPFETCTIHDNTWPILGFFCGRYRSFFACIWKASSIRTDT